MGSRDRFPSPYGKLKFLIRELQNKTLMKETWTRQEVIELLIQALHDSPDMVYFFPDGTVKDIKREGMFGFDAFVIKHLLSKKDNDSDEL